MKWILLRSEQPSSHIERCFRYSFLISDWLFFYKQTLAFIIFLIVTCMSRNKVTLLRIRLNISNQGQCSIKAVKLCHGCALAARAFSLFFSSPFRNFLPRGMTFTFPRKQWRTNFGPSYSLTAYFHFVTFYVNLYITQPSELGKIFQVCNLHIPY